MIKEVKRKMYKSQYRVEEDFRIAMIKEIKEMKELGYELVRKIEEKKTKTYLMEYKYKEGKI